MSQLQHGLAVVKVVARQQLFESDQVLSQVSQLRVVKLLEERRNGFRRNHSRKTREKTRQLRINLGEIFDRGVGGRHARAQLQIEDVTLGIRPLVGGRAARS